MQFTLDRAQKLLQKLRDGSRYISPGAVISIEIMPNVVDKGNSVKKIQDRLASKKEEINSSLAIKEDLYKLKEALFGKNVTSGVSSRLARIDFLQGVVKTKDQMLESLSHSNKESFKPEEITADLIAKVSTTVGDVLGTHHLNVDLANGDNLRAEIRNARVEITQLEDEVRALNANTKVDFDFSAASREVLGL